MPQSRTLLCLLLLISAPALSWACEKTVRWANDPPYDMPDSNMHVRGATSDLLREVLRRMDCKPRFIKLPWARGLRNLENGSLDILPGALITPERETFAYFSAPIHRSPNVLFMNREASRRFAFDSLSHISHSNFRLGIQIGVIYSSEYAELIKHSDFRARTVPVTDRRGAWQMLSAGRLDGLIADEVTGLLELQQLGLTRQIIRSQLVVSEEPAVVAFSRKSLQPEFVEQFNAVLATVVADGTYARITQPYLPCIVSAANLGCRAASAEYDSTLQQPTQTPVFIIKP